MIFTEIDLAYLAGFVDGEGSITIFRSGGCDNLRFDVYNTNEDVLLWIKETFGGRVHKVGRPGRENWKQEYSWQSSSQQAAKILIVLLPYLKIKRLQAEIFIAHAATSEGRRGKAIPDNVVPYRRDLVARIQKLNRRGRLPDGTPRG